VVADGDCWKLQSVFVFNGDVNIFRMRNKIQQFTRNEVCKERTKSEDYQQPKNPGKQLTKCNYKHIMIAQLQHSLYGLLLRTSI